MMTMFRINLDEAHTKKVSALLDKIISTDSAELEPIESALSDGADLGARLQRRYVDLLERQKFLTKNNLMMVLVMQAMARFDHTDEGLEATKRAMEKFGLARGRPDAS